jgi:hypothetical protein
VIPRPRVRPWAPRFLADRRPPARATFSERPSHDGLKKDVDALRAEATGLKRALSRARLGLKEFDLVIKSGGKFDGHLVGTFPGLTSVSLPQGSGHPIVAAWWSMKHNPEYLPCFPVIRLDSEGEKKDKLVLRAAGNGQPGVIMYANLRAAPGSGPAVMPGDPPERERPGSPFAAGRSLTQPSLPGGPLADGGARRRPADRGDRDGLVTALALPTSVVGPIPT